MTRIVLRVLAAAALGVSAYVHLHLAHRYSYPGTITGTELFRVQGIVAAVIAVVLLLTGNRWVWLAALAIGLASFAAVMLYRYVDVGAIGPLPNMNDATWQPSPDKLLSAIAEASVVLWWLLDQMVARSVRKPRTPRPAGARQPVGS